MSLGYFTTEVPVVCVVWEFSRKVDGATYSGVLQHSSTVLQYYQVLSTILQIHSSTLYCSTELECTPYLLSTMHTGRDVQLYNRCYTYSSTCTIYIFLHLRYNCTQCSCTCMHTRYSEYAYKYSDYVIHVLYSCPLGGIFWFPTRSKPNFRRYSA